MPKASLLVLTLPHRFETAAATKILRTARGKPAPTASGWPQACSIAATTGGGWRGCSDSRRRHGVPLIATNDVLYHHPERRPLQDVLTCIREKTTIEAAGSGSRPMPSAI